MNDQRGIKRFNESFTLWNVWLEPSLKVWKANLALIKDFINLQLSSNKYKNLLQQIFYTGIIFFVLQIFGLFLSQQIRWSYIIVMLVLVSALVNTK